jgi:hypothetical protein
VRDELGISYLNKRIGLCAKRLKWTLEPKAYTTHIMHTIYNAYNVYDGTQIMDKQDKDTSFHGAQFLFVKLEIVRMLVESFTFLFIHVHMQIYNL